MPAGNGRSIRRSLTARRMARFGPSTAVGSNRKPSPSPYSVPPRSMIGGNVEWSHPPSPIAAATSARFCVRRRASYSTRPFA